MTELEDNVVATIQAARERAPKAHVVILGIPPIDYLTTSQNRRRDQALETAARRTAATWVPAPTVELYPDDMHPSRTGQLQYAAHIEKIIVDEGITGYTAATPKELPDALRAAMALDRSRVREHARLRFSVARMAAAYLRLYEDALLGADRRISLRG